MRAEINLNYDMNLKISLTVEIYSEPSRDWDRKNINLEKQKNNKTATKWEKKK